MILPPLGITVLCARASRVMDLIAPIGKGQRGLIVAPPRAGKTILLQKIANAIAEKRIYPAIDINRSGTRKEELLFSPEELNRVTLLRTFLADMPEAEAIEFLLKQMSRSKNNREFFVQMREG